MKICEIVASLGEGGLESHVVELCNGLADKGHEVHVIIPPAFTKQFSAKVTTHIIPLHLSRWNVMLLWRLYKEIKLISPDVVHTHASKGAGLIASIKRFISYPCVATIHNKKKQLDSPY
jgi:glycosyltransferase involved in cell wall biosynthesis